MKILQEKGRGDDFSLNRVIHVDPGDDAVIWNGEIEKVIYWSDGYFESVDDLETMT